MAKKSSTKASTKTDAPKSEPAVAETAPAETVSTDKVQDTQKFVSSAQKVSDEIADDLSGDVAVKEPAESKPVTEADIDAMSDEELLNLVESDITDSQSELGEAIETETSDAEEPPLAPQVESSDGEEEVSSRAKKRIDTLYAREKAAQEERDKAMERAIRAEERLKLMEEQATKKAAPTEKTISDEELKQVLDQCIEQGDTQGILDVVNYKNKLAKDELINEYRKAEQEKVAQAEKNKKQWQTVVKEYSPEAYENEFLKADPDFDIRNQKSKLYQIADQLYRDTTKGYATRENGMVEAVRDAFILLLRSKKFTSDKKPILSEDTSETEGLKQRLAKERRKGSLFSGASSPEDTSLPKLRTEEEILDEVVKERRDLQRKRMGIGV
jgi:hypothetical protein